MSHRPTLKAALVILLTTLVSVTTILADIKITLNDSFIEEYKDRATTEGCFLVDKAHQRPSSPSKDGDMHVADRMDTVQLPMVAEIMNAKSEKAAVDLIHGSEGTGDCIQIVGVWRIWCEHGGNKEHIAGSNRTEPPSQQQSRRAWPATTILSSSLNSFRTHGKWRMVAWHTPQSTTWKASSFGNRRSILSTLNLASAAHRSWLVTALSSVKTSIQTHF